MKQAAQRLENWSVGCLQQIATPKTPGPVLFSLPSFKESLGVPIPVSSGTLWATSLCLFFRFILETGQRSLNLDKSNLGLQEAYLTSQKNGGGGSNSFILQSVRLSTSVSTCCRTSCCFCRFKISIHRNT